MPVIITAIQAAEDDIVADIHGSLWRREASASFGLVSQGPDFELVEYDIEPDDEPQVPLDDMDGFGPLTLLMRDGKPVGDTLPEPKPPRIVEFTWYLHGGKPYEERESWARALGFTPDDALMEKMGYPFYEVTLSCRLDTKTGEVTIVEAK